MKEHALLFTTRVAPTPAMSAILKALNDGNIESRISVTPPDNQYGIEGLLANHIRYVFVDDDFDGESALLGQLEYDTYTQIMKRIAMGGEDMAASLRIIRTLNIIGKKERKENSPNKWMVFFFSDYYRMTFMDACGTYCKFPIVIVPPDTQTLDPEMAQILNEHVQYVLSNSYPIGVFFYPLFATVHIL